MTVMAMLRQFVPKMSFAGVQWGDEHKGLEHLRHHPANWVNCVAWKQDGPLYR
jgi:hypothetical protein